MVIAFFYNNEISPTRGGTERVTYTLAHIFKNAGYEVLYISKNHNYDETFIIDNKITTYYLPNNIKTFCEENIKFINNLIINMHIDIIINQDALNNETVKLFDKTRIHSAKIITCLHFQPTLGIQYGKELFYLPIKISKPIDSLINILKRLKLPYSLHKALKNKKKLYIEICQNSDAITILSDKYIDTIKNLIPKQLHSAIYVVNNPLPYKYKISDIEYNNKKNIILFVGRLEYTFKRVDRLIKAWNMLEKKHNDWYVKIVGDGNDKERLKELVSKYNLKNIEFCGSRDPLNLYKEAKLLCLTSNSEGFPLVILEAIQNKVVPITFGSFESAYDIIKDGKNGFVIKPFDIKEFAQKIELLIDNKQLLETMANSDRDVLDKFKDDIILKQWQTLFKNIGL